MKQESKEIKVKNPEGSQYKYSTIGYYNEEGKHGPYISFIPSRLAEYLKNADPEAKYIYANVKEKYQEQQVEQPTQSVGDIDDTTIPF